MTAPTIVPAIELQNVVKTFGSIQALKGVNLTVRVGETVAFLGPNGAGKTTAISLMLGLRSPTKGKALVFGQDPRRPENRRRIGAMLQESGVPPTLQVREVVELFRRMYPKPLPTSEAVELAALTEKARARVGTLSGGQRQRLYFALAIVGNPDVLFLDEPTVAMDVESRIKFWERMRLLVKQGKTILLTTHNLEEADALADRIVVINQGCTIAEGTPEEIKARVGGKHIRFTAPHLRQEDLALVPGVKSISHSENAFHIVSEQPDATIPALLRLGIPLNALELQNAGLEEAFLFITNA